MWRMQIAVALAASVAGVALAQEGRPDGRGRGMRFDMRALRPVPQAPDDLSELIRDIPAVQEELKRHRQAMVDVLKGHLSLANEIDAALNELRQAGGDDAELEEAAAVFAPQAKGLAAKRAAALATHYANLARILNPEDKAQREEVHAQLAQAIIQRMASKEDEGRRAGDRFPAIMRWMGGPGQGGPRGRGRGDAQPRGGAEPRGGDEF